MAARMSRKRGPYCEGLGVYRVAVKERKLSYYIGETL